MKYFHLFGEILLQPLVFSHIVADELDGEFPSDFHGSLALALAVEPRFRPPVDSVLVGIDADSPLYVEALDIYLEVFEGINDALAC